MAGLALIGGRVSGKKVSIVFKVSLCVNATGVFKRFDNPIARSDKVVKMVIDIFIMDVYLFGCTSG